MALTVNIYSFKKKTNSTLQPDPNNPLEVPVWTGNCLVKSGSQIVAPDLEIGLPADKNVSKWNYAYIPDWSRYYFITDMTYDNGQWVFHLECDVLATYRTEIGSSTQYVARCEHTYNGEVTDTGYPTLSNVEVNRYVLETASDATFSSTLAYVVGIVNNDNFAIYPGVSYYYMTSTQVADLRTILLSSMDYMGVAPGDQVMAKTEVNPFQYVVSCKAFPTTPDIGTTVDPITLGWWTPTGAGGSTIKGSRLSNMMGVISATWKVIHHPQAATRGAYLNASPYCSYTLIWGPFVITLDPAVMKHAIKIEIQVYTDYVSGNAVLKVLAYNSEVLSPLTYIGIAGETSTQLAIDVAISQLSMNVSTNTPMGDTVSNMAAGIGTFGSMLSSGVSFASKVVGYFRKTTERGWNGANSRYGNANQIISEQNRTNSNFIGANLGYNTLTCNISGANGGNLAAILSHRRCEIYAKFANLVDENISEYGRPLCAMAQLSTIPGFIKCATAELPLNATAAEQEAVIDHLTGGFHYE